MNNGIEIALSTRNTRLVLLAAQPSITVVIWTL